MKFFPVTEAELSQLASSERKMATAMEVIGPVQRKLQPGIFCGLLHTITGQQISGKVHQRIWDKFLTTFAVDEPLAIANASPELLRQCGLSGRKAGYIQNISRLFAEGILNEPALRQMSDSSLRKLLLALPGIGHWTVDMLLIFTFGRKNILSQGDLGIQKGLRMLYGYEALTPGIFEYYHKLYSPLATIASFYLWEIASGKYPRWNDPATKK